MKSLLSSKLFFFLCCAGLGVILIQWIQLFPKSSTTHEEIQSVQKEVSQLETDQKRLQELNSFLQSDFFAEKEGRIKLGLQKKDEHVAVIDNEGEVSSVDASSKRVSNGKNASLRQEIIETEKNKNASVWWHYFFGDLTF